MSKHLSAQEVEERLGAIMKAFKELNGNLQLNLNSIASLLEDGAYSIKLSESLIERGRLSEEQTTESVAKSIRKAVLFMNRISAIAHRGNERADLDEVIDENIRFMEELKLILDNHER
jgi:hypothetical protein